MSMDWQNKPIAELKGTFREIRQAYFDGLLTLAEAKQRIKADYKDYLYDNDLDPWDEDFKKAEALYDQIIDTLPSGGEPEKEQTLSKPTELLFDHTIDSFLEWTKETNNGQEWKNAMAEFFRMKNSEIETNGQTDPDTEAAIIRQFLDGIKADFQKWHNEKKKNSGA